jgi:hypothetical protein
MSRKLATTIKDSAIPGKYKRVLEAYAAFANNDGTNIYASKEKLAKKAGASTDTVYRNTPDLIAAGILVIAQSHTCKVPNCNKGATHFTGVWGHYTTAYDILIRNLQNAETYLSTKQQQVNAAKYRKVGTAKCGTTQALRDSGTDDDKSAVETLPLVPSVSQQGREETSLAPLAKGVPEIEEPKNSEASSAKAEQDQNQEQPLTNLCSRCYQPDWYCKCSGDAGQAQPTPVPQPPSLTREETELLGSIRPVMDKEPNPAEVAALRQVTKLLGKIGVDPKHLLAYNRAHKTGKLVIRTARQYWAAVQGNEDGDYRLLNEYVTHDRCKQCDEAKPRFTTHSELKAVRAQEERERVRKENKAAEEQRLTELAKYDFSLPTDEHKGAFIAMRGDWGDKKLIPAIQDGTFDGICANAALHAVVDNPAQYTGITWEQFVELEWHIRCLRQPMTMAATAGFDLEEV